MHPVLYLSMTDLFIVESPSKIKKILGYLKSLGVNARVVASFGHIRDLDRKTLSIDVNDNFKPTYIPVKDKAKIIRELKLESKKCLQSGGTIWLASDFDREGESIAWHLYKVLKLNKPLIISTGMHNKLELIKLKKFFFKN